MNEATAPASDLVPSQPAAPLARGVQVTMGVAPTTLEEGWRLANVIAKAEDMIPKSFRGRPEAILVAIQMGIEVGFAPMQALQSIAVIGGRPGLWGDGLLALVMNAAVYQDHEEYFEVEVIRKRMSLAENKIVDERVMERRDVLTTADLKVDTSVAVCTFIRRGKPLPVTRRFSVGQAMRAGYLAGTVSKVGKEGPWQTHPDRMLAMRARGFAARDAFPDVLRGIRTAEELRDMPDDDRSLVPPPRTVHRLSEQQQPAPAPPDDTPVPTPIPPPSEPVTQTLGPVGIVRVDSLIGGPCAFLADGTQVWLASVDDMKEVEKFIGTSHRLLFSVTPVEGAPHQRTAVSFAIAE